MTLAEKLEQTITKRPNSYVPAHTLERLLRLPVRPNHERLGLNWAMHWGQGIALGTVRALMAQRGIQGPVASFIFLNLRLANDQTLENATGVGAPPWTWPRDEQVIDLLHKAIYAFATGAVADHLVEHAGSNGEQVGFRHHPDDWRDRESRKQRAEDPRAVITNRATRSRHTEEAWNLTIAYPPRVLLLPRMRNSR